MKTELLASRLMDHASPSFLTLLVGDWDHPEFRPAAALVEEFGPVRGSGRLEHALDACQAADELPDLVVLFQSRPDQFDPRVLDRLRLWAPLARIAAVLGSWCGGEARSGRPQPGVVRLYWHAAPAYLAREAQRLAAGLCPAWGLPLTAGEFDRSAQADTAGRAGPARLIAIHSPSYELADWLGAACRALGHATTWVRSGPETRPDEVAAVIWDGTCMDERELALVQVWVPLPVLALLDFPHGLDQQRAIRAGAHAVAAKPLRLEDLGWHLERLLAENGEGPIPSAAEEEKRSGPEIHASARK